MSQFVAPRQKILGHLDRIQLVKAGERPAPVNVEIDLSNRCSLGCKWCHFAYTHTRGPLAKAGNGRNSGGDLMDTGVALALIDELHLYGVRGVIWAGGGEPTLHPDFDQIIANCRIPQGVYTHGGHVSVERAAIMKRHLEWVVVSLDAVDAESYRRGKQVAYFERANRGIRNLVAADGPATVGVSFLLNAENWRQVDRMVHLALTDLGADYVTFRPTILYDEECQDAPAENASWAAMSADHLRRIAGLPGIVTDPARFDEYADWLPGDRSYSACYWSAIATVITPDGSVWTCCNKREHEEAFMGNVTIEPFREIWQRSQMWTGLANCRVMCRGHVPNMALAPIFEQQVHGAFI